MRDVHDKVVVVTGAAGGIGGALARSFAADGARLVLADLHADVLDEVAATLAEHGTDVLAVPTDVADADAVERLAEAAVERFGAVHVVCNNAGALAMGPAWEIPLADWRRVVDVNLWGVIHGIRSFVPRLLAHDEPGWVVNTSSMAGVMSLPSLGPYVASKHAVVGATEVLAHDLAAAGVDDRIGVSVLCPGYVPSRLGRDDPRAPIPDPPPGHVTLDDVAAAVRAAMAEGRFQVFTHPGSTDIVTQRSAATVEGITPFGMAVPDPT
jgi:NAD(P)-dependent dehydrogenase (short-subunit alcohol dehydrogenase family)